MRTSRVFVLIPVVLALLAWPAWAAVSYFDQHATAEAAIIAPVDTRTVLGTNNGQVHSATATFDRVTGLVPPCFSFRIAMDATIDGERRPDEVAYVSFSDGGSVVFTSVGSAR